MTSAGRPELFGRSLSHYTRVARIFAHELGVEVEFVPLFELTSLDPAVYGENPALKMPTLRIDGQLLFGTENICRRLAESSELPSARHVVWGHQLTSTRARNAHELAWHCMAAEVQIVTGNFLAQLPADNGYFVKGREGFAGALRWLDEHLPEVLAELPAERSFSSLEVVLFCLLDHVPVRGTMSLEPYARLRGFAAEWGRRASARATPYVPDPRPS